MRPSRGRSWLFLGPQRSSLGWAGAKPGGRWLSPLIWGSDPRPRDLPKGPPPPGKPPLQTRVLVGPWQPLPPHPHPRQVDLICLQTPCVQWQVEKSLSGAPFPCSLHQRWPCGVSGPHAPRGPHIWQRPKRAGHSQDRSALLRRARVGWAGGGARHRPG